MAADQQRARRLSLVLHSTQQSNLLKYGRNGYRYDDPIVIDLAFEGLTLCGYRGQRFHALTEEGRYPRARSTIYRRLAMDCLSPLTEVGYTSQRFNDAVGFYLGHYAEHYRKNARFFTLSNDMTAVAGRLTARRQDGALFGLATLRALYVPPDLAGLMKLIDEHRLANNVDVVLLNPLDPRIPSFVLGVFPRAQRVTADVIRQMWAVAVDELDSRGLYVVAIGADGDSAHLSAMKKRRVRVLRAGEGLPAWLNEFRRTPREKLFSFKIKDLDGSEVELVVTCRLVHITDSDGERKQVLVIDSHFQDWGHVNSKLRNRLAGRDHHGVRMGSGRAEVGWLIELLGDSLTADTGVLRDDLNPKTDPMNVKAGFRLTGEKMRRFVQACVDCGQPGAIQLQMYLKLMHHAVRAFSDPDVALADRVRWLAWSRFFVIGWRRDALKTGDAKDEFLTTNQYDCICLNAEEFILFCRWLISMPDVELMKNFKFAPHVFGEQQNEGLYRILRALYNDRNFSVEGGVHRINHWQMHAIIAARRRDDFSYPAHRKHLPQESFQRAGEELPAFTGEELRAWVEEARLEAIRDLALVGIECGNAGYEDEEEAEDGNDDANLFEDAEDREDAERNVDVREEDLDAPASSNTDDPGLRDGGDAAATVDAHRTWKQLYTGSVRAAPLAHPHGEGCVSERPYLQRGREVNKKVDCGSAGLVNMEHACSLALGQRPRLSNDRTTRVRQAKAPRRVTAQDSSEQPRLTNKQLLDLGRQRGLAVTTRMNKAQLEALVLGAAAPASDTEGEEVEVEAEVEEDMTAERVHSCDSDSDSDGSE